MKIKTVLTAILSLALLIGAGTARADDAPDYFGKGLSARAAAMGSAFVAVTDASDSTYWNPAGLAMLENISANTTHSSLSDFDMTSDLFTVGYPLRDGRSSLGLGIYRSSISNIEIANFNATTGRYSPGGYFSEREMGLQFAYANQINDRVALGATIKYLDINLHTWSASGFGLDLGAIFDAGYGFKFGVNLQNVIPLDLGPDEIPFNAKVGLAYTTPDDKLTIAADFDTNVAGDGSESIFHVGAEYWIVPQIAARIGSNDGELTAGIGLAGFGSWSFDYAYDDADVGDTHRFTVRFDFIPDAKKKRVKKIVKKVKKKEEPVIAKKEVKKEEKPAPKHVKVEKKAEEQKPVAKKAEKKPAVKKAPAPEYGVKKAEPAPKKEVVAKPAPKPAPKPAAAKPAPEPEPVVVKPEPKPAPKPVAVKPAPEPEPVVVKPEPKPEPKPVAVKPVPKPAPKVVEEKLSIVNAYSFYEEETDTVSISYTDLTIGQSVRLLKDTKKVADIDIIEIGLLSSTGKITKLYIDRLTGYLIGDQVGFK